MLEVCPDEIHGQSASVVHVELYVTKDMLGVNTVWCLSSTVVYSFPSINSNRSVRTRIIIVQI